VAQIARALARALKLDEDLAEGVALVHDFGHTPFGHTGEEALDELLADAAGSTTMPNRSASSPSSSSATRISTGST
jgi:HD superfamily phosphohydrolase